MNPQKLLLPAIFLFLLGVLSLGVWGLSQLFSSMPGAATSTPSRSFFSSLFPFGSGEVTLQPQDTLSGDLTSDASNILPELRQLTEIPSAGSAFATNRESTVVRYVERDSGNLFEARVDVPGSTRLSNTTITQIQNALWINASTTLFQLIAENGDIENFIASIKTLEKDQALTGQFIRKYSYISVGLDGKSMVGVFRKENGSDIDVLGADGRTIRTVYSSPLTNLVPVPAGNQIYVAEAPSSGIPSNLFKVENGSLTKVLSNIPGLLATSNITGSTLLLSTGTQGDANSLLFDTKTGTISQLPFKTLATKCAWSPTNEFTYVCAVPTRLPQGTYPDDWLLGGIHTSDSLVIGNARTGSTTVAAALENEGSFDVAQISLDRKDGHATFMDRNTGTIWLSVIKPLE